MTSQVTAPPSFAARESFTEMTARERARALLDAGSFRELAGPFDRITSPWLPLQGIVCQADDGVVIARGTIDGEPAVVAAIESAFQGGSIGEVAGSKIAGALELALRDCENGQLVRPLIVFETGGVRLQEANLGLAVIAEIQSAIVGLRKHVPVVGVIAGMVGCFGGMSLAAGLASYIVMTREARLGMNGPEVIEQENGVEEFDSSDRALIWAIHGGEQRYTTGLADALVDDDARQIANAIRRFVTMGVPTVHRSSQVTLYRNRIEALDTSRQWDPKEFRALWTTNGAREGKR
jgi:malonate decarboxylase beta subunit